MKEPLLSPRIDSFKGQRPNTIHDTDTSDMTQIDFYTSNDNPEFNDNVFDVDPICNDYDDSVWEWMTQIFEFSWC